MRDVHAHELTNYPLALTAVPGPPVSLQLKYDRGRFDAASARRLLEYVERLLEEMSADPKRTIAELSLLSGEERIPELNAWLVGQGLQVYALAPQRLSLEELFVQIMDDSPAAEEQAI